VLFLPEGGSVFQTSLFTAAYRYSLVPVVAKCRDRVYSGELLLVTTLPILPIVY